MSLGSFLEEHGQKLYGSMTAGLGTLGALLAAGAFTGLISDNWIKGLAILVAVATAMLGGAVTSKANSVTAKVRIAEAMKTAVEATPGEPIANRDVTSALKPLEPKP